MKFLKKNKDKVKMMAINLSHIIQVILAAKTMNKCILKEKRS